MVNKYYEFTSWNLYAIRIFQLEINKTHTNRIDCIKVTRNKRNDKIFKEINQNENNNKNIDNFVKISNLATDLLIDWLMRI